MVQQCGYSVKKTYVRLILDGPVRPQEPGDHDNPDTYPPTDSTDEDFVDHVQGWWDETDEIATGD